MTRVKSGAILRLFVSFLLGAATVLAFAPVGIFPLTWLTLAGLFALLNRAVNENRSAKQGALITAAFCLGLFVTGVSWVYVSLHVYGGMPAVLAALATFLFAVVLSVFPALGGAVFVHFAPTAFWQRGVFFAALWVLGEWLRGWGISGFPWLVVGYSQTPPSPLSGFAPVLGVYGVSLITVVLAALLATTVQHARKTAFGTSKTQRIRMLSAPLLLASLLLLGGQALRTWQWTIPEGPPISVSLLQGNVPQDLKWRPEKFTDSLRIYYRLALENPAQLTVFPETAIPAFLEQVPDEYFDELKKLADRQHGDMLIGIPIGDLKQYANGAASLGQAKEQRYSKTHLVPFGEFIPPGFAWFLAIANIPMSSFTPGAERQPPMHIAGQKVAVNICYEDAFGEEIIRALPEATLLVNLSNIAWFGDSLAPAQHLQIAQMRTLESGRMMLRATNTGMTAIIGADGQVQSTLQPFTRAALRGMAQGYTGTTPFVRWGNHATIIMALLLIAFLFLRKAVS